MATFGVFCYRQRKDLKDNLRTQAIASVVGIKAESDHFTGRKDKFGT